MARYKVKERSYINNRVVEAGEIIEFAGRSGKNLEKIEAPAKVAPPAPAKSDDKKNEG